jgi:RimJ/RimL family protein N-acetyltransferase
VTIFGEDKIVTDTTLLELEHPHRPPAIRAGKPADFTYVLKGLQDAVGNNEHYGDEFKRYELGRLNRRFLAALHAADPYHIAICIKDKEPVGFILTGPELGNLWLFWVYIEPRARRSDAFIASMRALIRQFDNGRFHKISTYTRPGNAAPAAVIRRIGYKQIALLEHHIFGEDYLLFERPLNKIAEGYDHGAPFGRGAAIKRFLKRLPGFGRA